MQEKLIIDQFLIVRNIINDNSYTKVDFLIESIQKEEMVNFIFYQLNRSTVPTDWFLTLIVDKFEVNTQNYWYFEFLRTVSNKNILEKNARVLNSLNEIINKYIQNKALHSVMSDRYICMLIGLQPIDFINHDKIDFILHKGLPSDRYIATHALEDILTNNIENYNGETKEILKYIFEKFISDDEYEKLKFDPYYISTTIETLTNKITDDSIRKDFIDILIKVISKKAIDDVYAFSTLKIVSISDDSQNWDTNSWAFIITMSLRNLLNETDASLKLKYYHDFIQTDIPLFKRLAFYLIDIDYDNLKEYLWKFENNPLDISDAKLELYKLFKNHGIEISDSEFLIFKEWVNNIYVEQIENEPQGQFERVKATYQKEWLSALKGNSRDIINDQILKEYEQLQQISDREREHPGYSSYISMSSGYHSRLDVDAFLDKSCDEVVAILEEEIKKTQEDKFVISGLEKDLYEYVKKYHKTVSTNLIPFLKLSGNFNTEVISAFLYCWDDGESLEWGSVFEYIQKAIIEKPDIEIDAICSLISQGCRNDERAFSYELIGVAREILQNIFGKINFARPKEIKILFSQPSDLTNSTAYRWYQAFLFLALFEARKSASEEMTKRWGKVSEEFFNKEINSNSNIYLHYLFGRYLPQFGYLDEEWMYANLSKIFPKDKSSELWEQAFNSYLINTSTIYKQLYIKLESDYQYALKNFDANNIYFGKVCNHILIAYLEDWKEDTLLDQILKPVEAKKLIKFINIYDQMNHLDDSKLKPLWEKLLNTLDKFPKDQVEEIKIELFNLVDIATDINAFEEIIIETIPQIKADYSKFGHVFRLVTQRKGEKEITSRARILIEILNRTDKNYPLFGDELKEFLDLVYGNHLNDFGDKICMEFLERGYFQALDIYESYNKEYPA